MAGTTWGEYADEAIKKGVGFGPHPEGAFNMRVESAEVKPAKNNKKAVLARMVTIDGPAEGKSLLNNMTPYKNDGDENGYFMQELAALGFGKLENPQFWAQLEALDHEQGMAYISQAIVGATATVIVNRRLYNKEQKDNVKRMVPLGAEAATTTLAPEIPGPVTQPQIPAVGVPAAPGAPAVPTASAPVAAAPTPVVVNVAPAAPAVPVAAAPAPTPVAAAPTATPVVAQPVAPAAAPVAVPVADAPVEAPTAAVPTAAVPAQPVAAVPVAAEVPVLADPPEGSPF